VAAGEYKKKNICRLSSSALPFVKPLSHDMNSYVYKKFRDDKIVLRRHWV
jgi:hypothetical protein